MEQTMFEQNIDFLKGQHEAYKEYVEALYETGQQAFPIETFVTADEQLGMYQSRGGDGVVQFNSKYNAQEFADIWADAVIRENRPGYRSSLFVFGLGSGIYLEKLLERVTKDTYVIVYEPSKEAFVKLIQQIPLEELWKPNVVILVRGFNDIMFRAYFEYFIKIDNQNLEKLLSIPNYSRLFAEDYMWFYHEIQRCNDLITVNMNTYINYARENTRNQIALLPYLVSSYSLVDYVLKLPMQMPAIVVGAGPSLRKNIQELRRAKGRALIMAVDSSVKVLLKEGIVPDIYFTVDANKPLCVFEGEDVARIPLCLSGMSRVEAAEMQKNKVLFSMEEGYMSRLMDEFGKQKLELLSGGTVTQSAFSMALCAKMNPIILVGQDLAYTDDKTHTEGSHRTDVRVNAEDREESVWVEDADGNLLRTAPNMLLYKKWFENRIAQNPDVRVINATEGGAKIEGAERKTLCDVIDEECTSTVDYDIIMNEVQPLFDEAEQWKLCERYRMLPGIMVRMKENACEGRKKYERIAAMAQEEQLDVDALSRCMKEIDEITRSVEGLSEYELILPYVKQAERSVLTDMAQEDSDPRKDLETVAEKGIRMYDATIDAIEHIMPEIDSMLHVLDKR